MHCQENKWLDFMLKTQYFFSKGFSSKWDKQKYKHTTVKEYEWKVNSVCCHMVCQQKICWTTQAIHKVIFHRGLAGISTWVLECFNITFTFWLKVFVSSVRKTASCIQSTAPFYATVDFCKFLPQQLSTAEPYSMLTEVM